MSNNNDDMSVLDTGLFDDLATMFAPVNVQAGSITLVNHWGSDEAIITAARQSTQRGFKGWGTADVPGDEKLLAYLYTHKHMTPFEMCGATFDVKLPIFVAREWQRHRSQSFNEASARYAPLPNSHYTPSTTRMLTASTATSTNKQERSTGGKLSYSMADDWLMELDELIARSQLVYDMGLQLGVPKELARLSNLVTRHTYMRVSANLRNWMQFMVLRQDTAAQLEIREYADAVNAVLGVVFPRSMALFNGDQSKVTPNA